MQYVVQRITVEIQTVEANSPEKALDNALDYVNQYDWRSKIVFSIEEV
jgi:hypothetical protein